MANVRRFSELYGMQLHTAENLCELFDRYLSYGYSGRVQSLLKKDGVVASQGTIRKVRAGLYKSQNILNYIIKEAKNEKRQLEKFKKNTKSLIQNL